MELAMRATIYICMLKGAIHKERSCLVIPWQVNTLVKPRFSRHLSIASKLADKTRNVFERCCPAS